MNLIFNIFYNYLILPLLYAALRFAGLFNKKIRTGILGRKRVYEKLILSATSINKSKKLIWFHSSSLGEFEQAKPIIEKLKQEKDVNVLITFFSPSGYENSKKYPYADLVSYIPFDTQNNAQKFLSLVKPDLAIIMRYDIWPNHTRAMRNRKVPSLLVDATMKDGSPRMLPLIKNFHSYLFKDITHILTVSENDKQGFLKFGLEEEQITAVGDTRFDRVYQRSLQAKKLNLIKDDILKNKKILVAGSTWEPDEDIIIPAFLTLSKYDKKTLLIIAPHEPTIVHLDKIENEFAGKLGTIRFSHLNNYKDERVIIVDSIGILLTLYTYADAAFIGGSFKQNIHNILEAAVYGIPVLFGPKIDNSQESKQLLSLGGGVLIRNRREAYRKLRQLFSDDLLRNKKGEICYNFVHENLGATDKILKEIYKFL